MGKTSEEGRNNWKFPHGSIFALRMHKLIFTETRCKADTQDMSSGNWNHELLHIGWIFLTECQNARM